ncbi:hypothetical protein C5O19_25070 [Siphonobacter curvatus]|uniref:Uncharacterized protein n=1 Tax=Siphonobacter curvatus TaxID=2094562 RepID=A0A2S7IEV2_9BACT|nr:hypothetical protein C5O19_25070 [Siphonobacter curvatus]
MHSDQDEYMAYLDTAEVVKSMLSLGASTTQLTRIPNGYQVPTEVIYDAPLNGLIHLKSRRMRS